MQQRKWCWVCICVCAACSGRVFRLRSTFRWQWLTSLYTTWLHSQTHLCLRPYVPHHNNLPLPADGGRERRIAIVSYKSSQAHTHQRSCTHPCNFAMRCSSLSSLPLNPLAKGLFSIFSCVIWGQSRAIFNLHRSAGPKACSVFYFLFSHWLNQWFTIIRRTCKY